MPTPSPNSSRRGTCWLACAPHNGALLDDLAKRSSAALRRREELGSTGIGDGVALPHARLGTVWRPFGILARLREPLDVDAIDERSVDLVFLLVLPAGDDGAHLNALACGARRSRDPETAAALHSAMGGRSLSQA